MIDPDLESMYDILLSLFIGMMLILFFDQMFDKPRIVNVYK